MRRVTFMVHRYWMFQLGWKSECQRTSYYMPWGVVTVDELSKMEDERILTHPIDYLAGVTWDDDAPYEMN